jgi:flagella basal body P-ring formation protein FlgA
MRGVVLSSLLVACAAACTSVDGDRILGGDLARADTRFAVLPPELFAGFSPVPGSIRVLEVRLLGSISRQHGIPEEGLAELCFERPAEPLSEALLRPALERVLDAGTKLEIIEFSRYPVAKGKLVFSISDLIRPPAALADAPVIWRGHLKYGSGSSAAVWVKVRVLKLESWLETATAIPAHKNIQADQIAAKAGWRFPFAVPPITDVERVVGKQATRSLSPGQIIVPAMLAPPNEIERGDTVDVEVASGGVTLRFTAQAETAGRKGDTVVVFQVDTGRRFRTQVQEKGKVLISADTNRQADRGRSQRDLAHAGDTGSSRREVEESQRDGAGIAAGSLSR